ncbi:MAG TPA: type IV toxin-antitoxin system AbiEi family antitoxin domain-containing protein [Solirubrobacteraceae bacterium]|nr:type IV toxin-antitoxin system AbiEi family antitoxin domain-containing protein [Solirubrobacteraceae bacterium]
MIAALADAQHGVVARSQLLVRGLTVRQIGRAIEARRLNTVHRGVYAVGHQVLTREGRWMAAVLATGGVLSHATAAAAWDLRPTSSPLIHVTVAGDTGRARRRNVRVHRSTTLAPRDTTTHRGIAITTPARTIIDLARTLTGRPLEQLVDLADQRGLIDFDDLRAATPASLKAVLSRYSPAPTRSELEERFLRLCDTHGLPRPETNTRIEGIEVDFVWRDKRLIVEVDGYRYHRSPGVFESDREKDVVLGAKGWRVLRFTWAQVENRAGWVAAAITGARPLAA